MFYNRKYATHINDRNFIWFNEDANSNASFNIEKCPDDTDAKTYVENHFVPIPENLWGIYDNKKIVYFSNTIYVVSITDNKINNVYLNVYNPCFLNNGVNFLKKKSSRKDEMMFIANGETDAMCIGHLNKENMTR